jgi:hypothetical protein
MFKEYSDGINIKKIEQGILGQYNTAELKCLDSRFLLKIKPRELFSKKRSQFGTSLELLRIILGLWIGFC